jgi:hypothetical protein
MPTENLQSSIIPRITLLLKHKKNSLILALLMKPLWKKEGMLKIQASLINSKKKFNLCLAAEFPRKI